MADQKCPACDREVARGHFCPACGTPLGDPLEGRILQGRIQLDRMTTRGPVHASYEARHTNADESFSVKVLAPALAERDDAKRTFLEDAGMALGLMGRLLIPVREMAEEVVDQPDGSRLRIVFSVADAPIGPSLAEVVRRDGPLDSARAAACVRDVLRGMASAHAAGVVHGDLHPSCVFVEVDPSTGAERTRVADAGLSRCLWLRIKGQAPEDPGAAGSDGGRWIAPEQATGEAPGAAADIHAAGLLLYFALTGTTPWHAERGAPLLFEIQRSMPRPPSEIRKGNLPPVLDEVVARALEKDPASRFGTAEEFAARLDLVAREVHPAPAPDFNEDATMVGTMEDMVPAAAPAAPPAAPAAPPAAPRAPEPSPDETLAAPRESLQKPQARTVVTPSRPAPLDVDSTMAAPRPPAPLASSGDETISADRSAVAADRTQPHQRPPTPPPTEQRPPSRKAKSKPKPKQKPKATPPPPEPEPAQARSRKGRKGFRLWSVGGPVSVFAITGALIVGGAYGAVWSGYVDGWTIPRWLRSLTGRDLKPEVAADDVVRVPYSRLFVTVHLPASILRPISGDGDEAVYGRWALVRSPDRSSDDDAGSEESRIFARGEIGGSLGSEGFIRIETEVPPGTYRCDVDLRYGRGSTESFEVRAGRAGAHTERMDVRPDRAVLKVKVVPETGTVTLRGPGARRQGPEPVPVTEQPAFENRRAVIPGEILFGGDQDDESRWLYFGETYTVSVTGAEGYKDVTETVTIDRHPQDLTIRLVSDPGDRIAAAKALITKYRKFPEKYIGDSDVEKDKGVRVALAMASTRDSADGTEGAWDRVYDILESVEKDLAANGGDLGDSLRREDLAEAHRRLTVHHRTLAESAAETGDRARIQELRGRVRMERLNSGDARTEKARFAAASVRAWLKSMETTADAATRSLASTREMVETELAIVPVADRGLLQRDVGLALLQIFAVEAWIGGPGADAAGSRAAVGQWLDLAKQAWSDAESELLYKRLRARLAPPAEAAQWLLRGTSWTPGQTLPQSRLPSLTRADRLLLAESLKTWAADVRGKGDEEAANAIDENAWNAYATLFDPLPADDADEASTGAVRLGAFTQDDRLRALYEAARVALRVRGAETAREPLDEYLRARDGDPDARRLREQLVRDLGSELPQRAVSTGTVFTFVPGGIFRTGRGTSRS
ncbi:MAG: protein kinase domain-containing protein, partial [Planctomycetota bacterium]